MKPHLAFSKGASADLQELVRYTTANWGQDQCLVYVAQLEAAAFALSKGEGRFKDLGAIHPDLRVAKQGKHYIFCLVRPSEMPVIVAILHERMDFIARLKGRLGEP